MIIGIALSSLIISIICSIIFQRIFISKNLVDKINIRSSHTDTATRTGGISIFMSIFLISVFYYVQGFDLFNYSLLLPLSILLIVGFYDDVYQVDFKLKFIFQIIVAKIIIDNGLIIDNFHGILGIDDLNRIFAQIFTIVAIVAIINAINFIDGIDGLAISVISFFIICFEVFSSGSSGFKSLSIIVLASFIPLLYYNFKKSKKIFLGDSGSLFLGGLVSIYILQILSSEYIIKSDLDINKVLFVVSILFYPIIDLIRIFIIRISKRKSPFIADKNHLHHILLQSNHSHWKTTLIIIGMSVLINLGFQIIL
jgi:UDP-GlcNAc:undecaprenyl-phosphate/decaprenyl-phosphate GlcNAc-1-phosphate transferase